ncbi:four-carbon acid sugar kinase family protein [Terrabacter aerolatus]|uniref:Hrp-dependent type III effector protein n=1 Tax=Terrabacter aerolatus TaxID=422442 RepID=A0A512D6B7_9MICO|nr:four-carbon acid sugar kinase family protein [Terrabacter aerolatus]GEO32025.1 Hrp-dependent type III effector protein [Terrabacter aerolatus]
MSAPVLGIVADDLSGAAESASHLLLRVSRNSVVLIASNSSGDPSISAQPDDVLTVDTDSRRLDAADAVRAVRAAAALVAGAPVVVKKVDSLLRGHLAAEVAALADELGRTPVVAVANPALGRVVRDGVLHVGDTPLHETDLWDVEPTAAPSRVAEALHPLPTVLVPHTVVALGVDAVAGALTEATTAGLLAVCDAVTESDLAVVYEAATRGRDALLVGSGALAAVAAAALPVGDRRPGPDLEAPMARSLLLVLGTRASVVPAQLEQVAAARRAHVVLVQPELLLSAPGDPVAVLAGLPRDGVVVVALDPTAPADPRRSRALTEALADAVAPLLDDYDAAFLSGGETARAVLDRVGAGSLDVIDAVEHGTVVSRRPGGRLVVTRPGSFGGPSSLVRVAEHLLDRPTPHSPETTHTATRAAPGATTEENS